MVPLSLWGKDSNVTRKVGDISQKMVANISPVLVDLVREPDLWSSKPVRTALCDTLGFLSDDEYVFTFKKPVKPPRGRSVPGFR